MCCLCPVRKCRRKWPELSIRHPFASPRWSATLWCYSRGIPKRSSSDENESCCTRFYTHARHVAEGRHNSRLEVIRDPPKGKTIWHFDFTDMVRAKEILGDVACIKGNVPVALLHTGTLSATIEYCKQLIAAVGKGCFILSTGAVIDEANAENLRAMIKCAKEYGVY